MFNELKGKKWLVWILVAVGEIAVLLLVFRVGEVVGIDRANFDAAWGHNYVRYFGGPSQGLLSEVSELQPPVPAFGNAGTVLSVAPGALVIQDNHLNEKTVAVPTSTVIRDGTGTIALTAVPTGAQIVIIGAPDQQGQILARFIRIFPDIDSSSTGGY